MSFQPKQLIQYQAEHLSELQGDVSETTIEYILTLTPPFTEGNIIHDNACGSGAVFRTILTNDHPSNLHIEATDINPQFVEGCAELAKKNNWPVTASVQPYEDITFPDNYFDYSFNNFVFHRFGNDDAAARQVFRTLKPGGVAAASIWVYIPHVNALQHAHWRTRGQDGPMPALLPLEEFDQEYLRKTLVAGGFKEENIKFSEKTCFLRISNLERFAQLSWSYLGALPTGWSQSDEDKWDEATADIIEQLQSGDGITKNEKGETLLKMVACVALAKK